MHTRKGFELTYCTNIHACEEFSLEHELRVYRLAALDDPDGAECPGGAE